MCWRVAEFSIVRSTTVSINTLQFLICRLFPSLSFSRSFLVLSMLPCFALFICLIESTLLSAATAAISNDLLCVNSYEFIDQLTRQRVSHFIRFVDLAVTMICAKRFSEVPNLFPLLYCIPISLKATGNFVANL